MHMHNTVAMNVSIKKPIGPPTPKEPSTMLPRDTQRVLKPHAMLLDSERIGHIRSICSDDPSIVRVAEYCEEQARDAIVHVQADSKKVRPHKKARGWRSPSLL